MYKQADYFHPYADSAVAKSSYQSRRQGVGRCPRWTNLPNIADALELYMQNLPKHRKFSRTTYDKLSVSNDSSVGHFIKDKLGVRAIGELVPKMVEYEHLILREHSEEATLFIKTDETLQKKSQLAPNFGKDPRIIIALSGGNRLVQQSFLEQFHHFAQSDDFRDQFGLAAGKQLFGANSYAAQIELFKKLDMFVMSSDLLKHDAHVNIEWLLLSIVFELAWVDVKDDEWPLLQETVIPWMTRVVVSPSGERYLEFGKLPSGAYTTSTGTSLIRNWVILCGMQAALTKVRRFYNFSGKFVFKVGQHLRLSSMGDDALAGISNQLYKQLDLSCMFQRISDLGFVVRDYSCGKDYDQISWCSHQYVSVNGLRVQWRDPHITLSKMSLANFVITIDKANNLDLVRMFEQWHGQLCSNLNSKAVRTVYSMLYAKFKDFLPARHKFVSQFGYEMFKVSVDDFSIGHLDKLFLDAYNVNIDRHVYDDTHMIDRFQDIVQAIMEFSIERFLRLEKAPI